MICDETGVPSPPGHGRPIPFVVYMAIPLSSADGWCVVVEAP